MKKLLAIVLALLMLFASAACAERANVMTLSKPYLVLTEDGDSRDVDLSSLSLRLAAGTPGDVPTVQLDVMKSGKVVERGVLQVIDDQLFIEADGLSHTLAADLSAAGGRAQSLVNAAFADIDYLMDFKLPAFGGITIPKIDMLPLATLTMSPVSTNEKGTKSADIEIPYAMTKQLLSVAVRYRDSVPAPAQAYVGPLFDLVNQMIEGDSGFALKGRVASSKKKSTLTLDIIPVEGGVAAAPVAKVKLVSAKNQVDVTVDMYQGEDTVNVATFALTSAPKTAELSVALDIMSIVLVNGRLYPENGAQVATFEVNTLGQRMGAAINYGTEADTDFVNVTLNVPNQVDLSGSVQAVSDGQGGSAGTLALNAQTYGEGQVSFALTGDVAEGFEDVSFRKIKKTGGALNLLSLSDSQREQLTRELENLLNKFVSRSRIGKR